MSKIPTDLQKALAANQKAKTQWANLTPISQRDFTTWIESAKQLETRKRRVERACEMLSSGKRRPCCYAVVPMDLYKALGANAGAKATWGTLTPTEKRDLVAWVEAPKKAVDRKVRIAKACALLTKGKRHP